MQLIKKYLLINAESKSEILEIERIAKKKKKVQMLVLDLIPIQMQKL